jgi:DNA-binding MarR family transcriptional regulator
VVAARELRAMFSRLRRKLRELATADDLTPSETAVLIRLIKDGPASTSQLAGAERVRPQSMATTLSGLDRHGLIERKPDPDDGRKHAESDRKVRDEWLVLAMQDRYTEHERQVINEALSLLQRLTD